MTAKMARMPDLDTPLGALLRARRTPMGWKRLEKLTGFEDRTMRYWEGGVMPPLDKALVVAEQLGITLEELAEVVLGRPYAPSAPSAEPADDAVARAATVLDEAKPSRRQERQTPRPHRAARPSPEE